MSLIVVLAPNPRGLRHYVDPTAAYIRTFCGQRPELWPIDIKGGKASCFRCQKTAKIKGYE